MATDIITLKSTVPGTKEYAAQVYYMRNLVGLIVNDSSALRDRLIELKKNRGWIGYFQDTDKTWGCFLREALGLDPDALILIAKLAEKQTAINDHFEAMDK